VRIHSHCVRVCLCMCAKPLACGCVMRGRAHVPHRYRHIGTGTAWGGRAWQGTGGLPDACVRCFVNAHGRLRAHV
jgi:hypothetical protein